jgi:hypothetical protein
VDGHPRGLRFERSDAHEEKEKLSGMAKRKQEGRAGSAVSMKFRFLGVIFGFRFSVSPGLESARERMEWACGESWESRIECRNQSGMQAMRRYSGQTDNEQRKLIPSHVSSIRFSYL